MSVAPPSLQFSWSREWVWKKNKNSFSLFYSLSIVGHKKPVTNERWQRQVQQSLNELLHFARMDGCILFGNGVSEKAYPMPSFISFCTKPRQRVAKNNTLSPRPVCLSVMRHWRPVDCKKQRNADCPPLSLFHFTFLTFGNSQGFPATTSYPPLSTAAGQ